MLIDDYIYRHEQAKVPMLVSSVAWTEAHHQRLEDDGTITDHYWNPAEIMQTMWKAQVRSIRIQSPKVFQAFKNHNI